MNKKIAILILTIGLILNLINSFTDIDIFLVLSIPLVLVGLTGFFLDASKKELKTVLILSALGLSILACVTIILTKGMF